MSDSNDNTTTAAAITTTTTDTTNPTVAAINNDSPQVLSTPSTKIKYVPSSDVKDGDRVLDVMSLSMTQDDDKQHQEEQNDNVDFKTPIKPSAITTTTPSSASSTTKKSKPTTPSTTITSSSKIPSFLLQKSNNKLTYISMVHEAIVELGNHRSGSSVPAIQKHMKTKYDHLDTVKPKMFTTNVYNAIKTGVKEGRFVKIKNSYKMNTAWVNDKKKAHRAKEVQKKAAEKKRKLELEKVKAEKDKKKKEEKKKEEKEKKEKELAAKMAEMSKEDREKEEEKKRQREEAARLKAEAEEKARKIAERIKKRRFPMDDLELIAEDKELGVKRPAEVTKQPFMPFTFTSLIPFDDRPPSRKSTSVTIINACTATMSPDSRTVVSDTLQIYQFFRGDLGYGRLFPHLIPEFNYKHLLYAVNEVLVGNTKKSHLVPPLISYLFYISLYILTHPEDGDWDMGSDDNEENKKWESLKLDLVKLAGTLDETSWGQTLMSYLDLMERFYSSDATQDENCLRGFPITLIEHDDKSGNENLEITPSSSDIKEENEDSEDESSNDVIDGYHGYLGLPSSATHRGFMKLLRYDPWYLSAEEMMAMLRCLTDDILAMKIHLAKELERRDEESLELLKSKKAADSLFRKVRLAFEGPKWPKPKPKKATNDEEDTGKPNNDDDDIEKNKENNSEKKFKPTATKKEFEAAEKARNKANEQYEKGIRKLVTSTEPFGYDRNHSAYYHFHHDPDMIHIEMSKNSNKELQQVKSWHCIDNKTLFDNFVSSLDVRGVRENALYESMVGSGGSGLKRYLSDSDKKNGLLLSRKREEEDFERRLNNALIASADQGRRSGRLASVAKDEVTKIQTEMEVAKQAFDKQLEELCNAPDYHTLTGVGVLAEFEANENTTTRFSDLCEDDLSGVASFIADKILDLEDFCNELDPWERNDISRDNWISNIENICKSFEINVVLGPKDKNASDDFVSPTKRQRTSIESSSVSPRSKVSSSSLSQVLFALKDPLIELEQRIYSLTGLQRAVNEADEANDNMSTGSMDAEQKAEEKLEKIQSAWKKKLHSLNFIPTKRASVIREVLISAIAIARKGQLEEVLQDLRGALQLHRPGAAGRARQEALSVLEKHGGYEFDEDVDESFEVEDDLAESDDGEEDEDSSKYESYLCTEAMVLTGCLEGDNNADRVDWREAVMGCKTLSRFSALVAALSSQAIPKLQKLKDDRHTLNKAIKYWETGSKTRKGRTQKQTTSERYTSATEIWTKITATDEFVQGKVEGYPWWPARICVAKDNDVKLSLESLNRVLISFIGEPHLHVVNRDSEIRPFTGKQGEDNVIEEYPVDVVKNLEQSTAMARRIIRAKKSSKGDKKGFIEEKKTST